LDFLSFIILLLQIATDSYSYGHFKFHLQVLIYQFANLSCLSDYWLNTKLVQGYMQSAAEPQKVNGLLSENLGVLSSIAR